MGSFEVNGKTYETDDDGYLEDLNEWNEDVAKYIAEVEGVDLTEAQYTALRLIAEHATVLEWVMTIYNRTFQTAVSIVSAVPVVRSGAPYWRCSIRFTIVSELHR